MQTPRFKNPQARTVSGQHLPLIKTFQLNLFFGIFLLFLLISPILPPVLIIPLGMLYFFRKKFFTRQITLLFLCLALICVGDAICYLLFKEHHIYHTVDFYTIRTYISVLVVVCLYTTFVYRRKLLVYELFIVEREACINEDGENPNNTNSAKKEEHILSLKIWNNGDEYHLGNEQQPLIFSTVSNGAILAACCNQSAPRSIEADLSIEEDGGKLTVKPLQPFKRGWLLRSDVLVLDVLLSKEPDSFYLSLGENKKKKIRHLKGPLWLLRMAHVLDLIWGPFAFAVVVISFNYQPISLLLELLLLAVAFLFLVLSISIPERVLQ